jgi:hypothetical protein
MLGCRARSSATAQLAFLRAGVRATCRADVRTVRATRPYRPLHRAGSLVSHGLVRPAGMLRIAQPAPALLLALGSVLGNLLVRATRAGLALLAASGLLSFRCVPSASFRGTALTVLPLFHVGLLRFVAVLHVISRRRALRRSRRESKEQQPYPSRSGRPCSHLPDIAFESSAPKRSTSRGWELRSEHFTTVEPPQTRQPACMRATKTSRAAPRDRARRPPVGRQASRT